jgi:hypothetical protein
MAQPRRNPEEPTERTPKGYEVRVPKRREFFSNLKKLARTTPEWKDAARAAKDSATRRPKK